MKNEFPIPENNPKTWYYTCFYDFWWSGYCHVRIQKAEILDLSIMADIEPSSAPTRNW